MRLFANRLVGMFLIGMVAGCGASTDDGPKDVLSGTVTLDGQPVRFATLIATGADGKDVITQTGEDGGYQLLSPPPGTIQFRFMATPARPVTAKPDPKVPVALSPVPEPTPIPEKYTKPRVAPSAEYTKGKQRHDLPLTK